MKIFIVEGDEIKIDQYLKAVLFHGHSISICRTGEEAIRRYPLDAPYDLMLIDYDLPGNVTGEELVLRFPTAAANSWPKVLITTTNRDGAARMLKILGDKCFVPSWLRYGRPLIDHVERLAEVNGVKH